MTYREKQIFSITREVSLLSDFHSARIGCVVTYGKSILSVGTNTQKTHPLQKRLNIVRNFENYETSAHKAHAEVNALSHLIGKKEIDWSKIAIFTYREWKNGKMACSKPCKACRKLIMELGIKNVYYVNEFGKYVKERIL